MRAIIFDQPGGPEVLKLGEWQDAVADKGELLVKVHASAINRADTLQRRGKYPVPPGASPLLGLEMAGEVIGLGEGVDKWKIGDRVCGLLGGGGHAELVNIHQDMCMAIPKDMSYESAAAIPEVFLTAYQALFWLAEIKKNDHILIHAGASGVGTAAIQLAKLMDAHVFVTASSPKHDLCRTLGAELCVDYRTQDFHLEVMQQTKRRGVDIIIDFVAGPYFQRNLDSLALDGRMVMLSLLGGGKPDHTDLASILRKRLKIVGSTLRSRTHDYKVELTQGFYKFAWGEFENGHLKPVIDRVMDWSEIVEAHKLMEENKNAGKIVLKVS
ncbi:MAG: NAD(P)H-quinone oxidoreductase [Bacteroidia bacterium]|nr:NAD(P)H-quinone oxidoreductase [Bacteroidia bacterium]